MTNIDKLIDAAWKVLIERYSDSEGYYIMREILTGSFHYDGHDYTSYAEGLDLSECDDAWNQYQAEMEFIGDDDE